MFCISRQTQLVKEFFLLHGISKNRYIVETGCSYLLFLYLWHDLPGQFSLGENGILPKSMESVSISIAHL